MTKEEFCEWAERHSYKKDKFGHYQKTNEIGERFRYKIGAISVRLEKSIALSLDYHEWKRLRSGYFKHLSLNEKDQLVGLSR